MIRRGTNTGQKNRAVGYVRRSTDRQEQSIPDQKNATSAYVAENGLRFLRFHIDDAISGTSTLGRRAFLQMIGDAESSTRGISSRRQTAELILMKLKSSFLGSRISLFSTQQRSFGL